MQHLLPLIRLIIMTNFRIIMDLMINFIMFNHNNRFHVVHHSLLLSFNRLHFSHLSHPTRFTRLLLLLLTLLMNRFPQHHNIPIHDKLHNKFHHKVHHQFYQDITTFSLLRKFRLTLFGRMVSATRMLLRPTITRLMSLLRRTIRGFAIIQGSRSHTIMLRSNVLRSILQARIRVIHQLIRGRRITQFRRRTNRHRAHPLTTQRGLSLLISIFTTRRRHSRGVTRTNTSVPRHRPIRHVMRHGFTIRRIILVLNMMASVSINARPRQALNQHRLTSRRTHRHNLTLTITPCRHSLITLFSSRVHATRSVLHPRQRTNLISLNRSLSQAKHEQRFSIRHQGVLLLSFRPLRPLRLLSTQLRLVQLNKFVTRLLSRLFNLLSRPLLVLMDNRLLHPTFNTRRSMFQVKSLMINGLTRQRLSHTINRIIRGDTIIQSRRRHPIMIFRMLLRPLSQLSIRIINQLIRRGSQEATRRRFHRLSARTPTTQGLTHNTTRVHTLRSRTRRHLFSINFTNIASRSVMIILHIIRAVRGLFMSNTFMVNTFNSLTHRENSFHLRPRRLVRNFNHLFNRHHNINRTRHLQRVTSHAFTIRNRVTQHKLLFTHSSTRRHNFSHAITTRRASTILQISRG